MSPEIERKIADVQEAFGVKSYWSMVGCFCIETGDEFISLRPKDGGLWEKLSTAATRLCDLLSGLDSAECLLARLGPLNAADQQVVDGIRKLIAQPSPDGSPTNVAAAVEREGGE